MLTCLDTYQPPAAESTPSYSNYSFLGSLPTPMDFAPHHACAAAGFPSLDGCVAFPWASTTEANNADTKILTPEGAYLNHSSVTNSPENDAADPTKIRRPLKKPRVATTFWDKENTTCYHVKAYGIVVLRRENDNYVNGTKLLNVTGMSRGKRDGMLKAERHRQVVRNGSMKLKGVWIPFDRAREIARNEGVEELLHPLFVTDLKTVVDGQR